MFDQVTDYATVGQNSLSFMRYYNSMSVPDTYAVAMGANWRHVFDRYLHIINPTAIYGVTAERADGQYISFASNAGTYTADSDLDYKLTRSGSTWTLTDPDDTVETYAATGGKAVLQTIKRRNGYTQTMNYTGGVLTSVSDSYSRAVGFTYTGGMLTGVSTPDTATLAYGYVSFSSAKLLSTVTYNTSPTTHKTYLYENTSYPFALTGITDENNHRYATWAYDNKGRAVSSQLASGVNFTSVSYFDTTGNRAVKGPLGVIETYKFSTLQGVPKVTEIDRAANGTVAAATRLFTYDSNGYLKTATDWNGNQTAYTNNSHGLPTQIVYASGSAASHTTSITYDPTWAHLAKTITTPGLTTTNNYDATTGNLLTRVLSDTTSQTIPYSTNGQTRTWTYTWNTTGQLLTVQLPRIDVVAKTTFGYTGGTLTSITDALGHVTTVNTYKPGGLPLTVTDPNSVVTTLTYNPRNWLTSSVLATAAGNLTSSLQYDSAGNLTKATLPDNSYLAYAYDNAHRPTTISNALNETQGITYNSAGNITQVLWKNASAVTKRQHTTTFDALGRMRTDVGGVGQTTTFGYDSNGNVLSITDALSHVTTQTFDALNRLKTHTNRVHDLTQLTYDAHDRPLTVTDGKGNVTSYVYDGFGETIQETSPDRGTTVYWYDKDGNATGKKDGAIQYSSATYDALERPLTRTYPAASTINVAFTYDQTGHGKGIGRLTSLTDAAGSLSLSYDERGLQTANNRTIGTTAYNTGYTFESAGRLASITYPLNSWVTKYTRDAAGQVSGVSITQPSHSPINFATSVTHMPFGPVSGFTYSNGSVDTRIYDLDYRMIAVKDTKTGGNIQYSSFGYNATNDNTSIIDNVTPARNQTITYDADSRISYASSSGTYGTVSGITYDSNSNRLTYGATTYTYASTSNRLTAVNGSAVTTNAVGNITAMPGGTASYNKANQATFTSFGTAATYIYDAFGFPVSVTTTGSPTSIKQYDQDGNLIYASPRATSLNSDTDYVWLDGFALAEVTTAYGSTLVLHSDNIGTPQKGTDGGYATITNWTASYDPNGSASVSGSFTQDLRRIGQYSNGSGIFANGMRPYDQIIGRFIQPDLIGLQGGMNPYAYAANNSYKYFDRTGLCLEDLCIGEAIIATEAVEALSAGVAEVSAILTAGEGAGATGTAAGTLGVKAAGSIIPGPGAAPNEVTPPAGAQCRVGQPASAPVGRSGSPIEIAPGTNTEGQVFGRNYVDHAFDRLQGRGLTPSVVEDTISNGLRSADPIPGRMRFYSSSNNLTIITESDGTVVTVMPGRR